MLLEIKIKVLKKNFGVSSFPFVVTYHYPHLKMQRFCRFQQYHLSAEVLTKQLLIEIFYLFSS